MTVPVLQNLCASMLVSRLDRCGCNYGLVTESATEVRAPAQALVIVDAQTGFLKGEKAVAEAAQLGTRLGDLLARARRAGALIIHLQNDGVDGAVDEPGQPGWQLYLPPAEHEEVIRKSRDDGFAGTSLGQLLESHKVHRIVIGGLLSEMCVSATARTALSLGFQVVLPHDAHGTYDVDGIPASVVARVAEHALGDGIELADSSAEVRFTSSKG
jgi:nicotinamidase-related amidase